MNKAAAFRWIEEKTTDIGLIPTVPMTSLALAGEFGIDPELAAHVVRMFQAEKMPNLRADEVNL